MWSGLKVARVGQRSLPLMALRAHDVTSVLWETLRSGVSHKNVVLTYARSAIPVHDLGGFIQQFACPIKISYTSFGIKKYKEKL